MQCPRAETSLFFLLRNYQKRRGAFARRLNRNYCTTLEPSKVLLIQAPPMDNTCYETGLFFKLLKLIARHHVHLQLLPTRSSFTLYKIRNFPRSPCSLNLILRSPPSLPSDATERRTPLVPTPDKALGCHGFTFNSSLDEV